MRFFGEVSRTTAPNRPGSHPISRIPTYFQPANIPAGGVTEGFPPVADAVPWRFSRAFQLAAIGGDLTVFRRAGHGVTPAHFFGGAVFRSAAGAPRHAPKPGITPGFAPKHPPKPNGPENARYALREGLVPRPAPAPPTHRLRPTHGEPWASLQSPTQREITPATERPNDRRMFWQTPAASGSP